MESLFRCVIAKQKPLYFGLAPAEADYWNLRNHILLLKGHSGYLLVGFYAMRFQTKVSVTLGLLFFKTVTFWTLSSEKYLNSEGQG